MGAEDTKVAWMEGAEGGAGTRDGEGAGATRGGEGDAVVATLALSHSIRTWAKCPPFYSSCKAAMTISLRYVSPLHNSAAHCLTFTLTPTLTSTLILPLTPTKPTPHSSLSTPHSTLPALTGHESHWREQRERLHGRSREPPP